MGKKGLKVSVPYRGAKFLNSDMDFAIGAVIGFRPLSGSYISQFYILYFRKLPLLVSVPYRGATFLNLLIYPLQSI